MFIPYNPNPIKHTDDCVVRAISKVLDTSWEKAFMELCLKGFEMYDMPHNNSVWGSLMRDNGFVRENIPNSCPDCYTIEDFCKDHPIGVYVVGTGTHAVAVVDGNIYDSYYSGDKIPTYFFRRK